MGRFIAAAFIVLGIAGPGPAQTVLVEEGDLWSFFRGRQAPPADWAMPDFDPAAAGWEQGRTGIGYSDDDDATVLDDMQNNYMAVFLRIAIDVPEGLEGSIWLLRVRYDDSFVAYLDGQEVARRGIDGIPPAFDAPSSADHEITTVVGFDEDIPLPDAGAILLPGRHVLAAEVHNNNLTSTDLSFSAELSSWPFIVTSFQPAMGPIPGGNTVTISGLGFDAQDPPQVQFGGVPCSQVVVVGPQTLEVIVPPGNAPGPVSVTDESTRGSFVCAAQYTYTEAAQVGLDFDGADLAMASCFREDLDEGAFEMWFRRYPEGVGTWRVLLAVEAPGGTDAFRIEVRFNRIRARTWIGGNVEVLQATPGIAGDTWYHLAFTFSRMGQKLYLDGALVASSTVAMTISAGMRLCLGSGFTAGAGHLGSIESARVWAFERTAEEIQRDRYARLDASADVEAAWFLDEGMGPVAFDVGPWENDLILGTSTGPEDSDPTWITFDDFPLFAVTEMTPDRGPLQGGGTVRIYGTGFDGETPPSVVFGYAPSPEVIVQEAWMIQAVVPPGSGYGYVDVSVQTTRGTIQVPGGYTYEPDAVYSLVREGDLWDYFVGVQAPPSDWTDIDFEPPLMGWSRGPSGLGYGDEDDATDLPEIQNTAWTLYARATWELPGRGEPIDYLRMLIRYDDGFVAYLNNQEIARRLVDGTPPAFDQAASGQHEITGGTGHFDEEIDILEWRGYLRKGLNVLAIEVHNATLESTDMSLSVEVYYAAPGATFLRGDVDHSGSRNITDAIKILMSLFAGWQIACEEAADVNDDGARDVSDAVVLLNYLFLGGMRMPIPYDVPLPNLDGDPLLCER